MNWQKILVPIAGVALIAGAWNAAGWQGVAIVVGGIVMWMLLHFTRMMAVLKRSSDRPVGWVGSAVMLNAKLRPGVNLLHVMAITRSLGELVSPKDSQPEIFRWTDGTESSVSCEFVNGKLVKWALVRPPAEPEAGDAPAP
ncbi:glycerate kinase [uncultured Ramlibacter sp.]|uniref:glycerate kinase n=1 Tax=uncultured Ramlibacter sp. TaxID=260755 RepID=UPI0026255DFF|nr:glycerate kinase [uncultured Ramlibacter sp.]